MKVFRFLCVLLLVFSFAPQAFATERHYIECKAGYFEDSFSIGSLFIFDRYVPLVSSSVYSVKNNKFENRMHIAPNVANDKEFNLEECEIHDDFHSPNLYVFSYFCKKDDFIAHGGLEIRLKEDGRGGFGDGTFNAITYSNGEIENFQVYLHYCH